MSWNWSSEGTLAAVVLAWAGIWWLRRRGLNFSIATLLALAVGIPIGIVAGNNVQAIDPIGEI
jgi:ABC-type proline/glycine betaine transport system permease subunit